MKTKNYSTPSTCLQCKRLEKIIDDYVAINDRQREALTKMLALADHFGEPRVMLALGPETFMRINNVVAECYHVLDGEK